MKIIKPKAPNIALSIIAVTALLSPVTVSALPLIDVHAGIGAWIASPSGDIQADSDDILDIESDLNLQEETNIYGYISFEHPTPIIPNLRVGYTQITTEGTSELSRSISFGDLSLSASEDADSTLDLTMLDATIYYGIGAIWATADIGVNVRHLNAIAEVTGKNLGITEKEEADAIFPMLYAKARFNLPLTDTYIIAEGQGISFDGNAVTDYSARIGYEGFLGLGLEAGFRSLNIELDDVEDINADLELSGPFLGAQFSF